MEKKCLINTLLCATAIGTICLNSSTMAMAAVDFQEVASFVTQNRVTGFYGDIIQVEDGDKYGFIDIYGKSVSNIQWSEGERNSPHINESFIIISKDDLYGIMNLNGTIVVKPQYDSLWYSQKNLYIVLKNEKYGCIDHTGKIVVPIEYDKAPEIYDNKAIVEKNGKYGCVDLNGETLIENEWDYLSNYTKGLYLGIHKNKSFVGLVNEKGDLITTFHTVYKDKTGKEKDVEISEVYRMSGGLTAFETIDDGSGVIDSFGNILFYKENSYILGFINGIGAVNEYNGNCILINAKGEVLKTLEGHVDKITENDRIFIRKHNILAIMDYSGNLITNFNFYDIRQYDSNSAVAKGLDGLWKMIDLNGNTIREGNWFFMTPCKGGLVIAEGIDEYVLLDKQGNIVSNKTWESLGDISNGSNEFISYLENGKFGLLDGAGNIILNASWDRIIQNGERDSFLVKRNNQYIVLNYNYNNVQNTSITINNDIATRNYTLQKNVFLVVNGEKIDLDMPVLNINNRIYYPFRECLELIGAEVIWDEDDQIATGILENKRIEVPLKPEFIANSENTVDPVIYLDRIYMPIRYTAESLGYTVEWTDGTVYLYKSSGY